MSKKVACPHCGSTSFNVFESLHWKAEVSETNPNVIDCWNKGGEIEHIYCSKCSEEITELVIDCEFNFA